jgi:hypothetical protein
MFNTIKQKLTPSNQTKQSLQEVFKPSQAKMNYLRNKTQKVGNYFGTLRNKGKAGYNSLKKGMSGMMTSSPSPTGKISANTSGSTSYGVLSALGNVLTMRG